MNSEVPKDRFEGVISRLRDDAAPAGSDRGTETATVRVRERDGVALELATWQLAELQREAPEHVADLARQCVELIDARHAAWFAETRAQAFLDAAREMLGWFTWVPSGLDWASGRVSTQLPGHPKNSFLAWLIEGGPEPGRSAKMNCWEAHMYIAYCAGFVGEAWLRRIHVNAHAAAKAARYGRRYYTSLMEQMCPSERSRLEVDPVTKISTPDIPAGSVIFMGGPNHVVVSRGTRDDRGHQEVVSHWGWGLQKTTLDKLIEWYDIIRAMKALDDVPAVLLARNPDIPVFRPLVIEFATPIWMLRDVR
ncbi:hypothetical protein AB0L00_32840 [Actinoallomurus sp. NPDC052308]|uniref:hypothetical protein n=1 Tax=Actinoallomurus sp. NPDC052308 TaxID=3155530 RepID=UPI0034152A19